MTEVPPALITLKHNDCGWEGIPKLWSNNGMIGAYCPRDGRWIKWVPQTQVWTTLAQEQDQQRAEQKVLADTSYAGQLPTIEAMFVLAANECYDIATSKGWHETERTVPEIAALLHSEVSELFEAYRNSTLHNSSDHIPEFTFEEEEYADIIVRVFDHALESGVSALRLAQAFAAKVEFNRSRPYRHGGKVV